MKKFIPYIVAFILAIVAGLQAIITNFATNGEQPEFLRNNPNLIWVSLISLVIGGGILSIVAVHYSQNSNSSVKGSKDTFVEKRGDNLKALNDIFVSYSSKDGDWVHNTLIPKLKANGFSVITDKDFKGGAFSDEQMEKAVVSSRHVLAIMSDDFFKSGWTKLEAAMTRLLDPGAIKRKLIPILIEDCTLPLRFQVLTYRDLKNDDPDEWSKLMRDVL